MTLVLPICLEWLARVAGTVLRTPILNWRMGLCLFGDFGICREPADFGSGPDRIIIDGWCEVRQYAKGERIGYSPGGKAWVSP